MRVAESGSVHFTWLNLRQMAVFIFQLEIFEFLQTGRTPFNKIPGKKMSYTCMSNPLLIKTTGTIANCCKYIIFLRPVDLLILATRNIYRVGEKPGICKQVTTENDMTLKLTKVDTASRSLARQN